jgi:hypothetical protein
MVARPLQDPAASRHRRQEGLGFRNEIQIRSQIHHQEPIVVGGIDIPEHKRLGPEHCAVKRRSILARENTVVAPQMQQVPVQLVDGGMTPPFGQVQP